jgi:hypothetical protein
MSFWIAGAVIVSTGAGLYESSQSSAIGSKAVGLAEDTQGKQDYYNNQLMQLMANPSSFLSSPLFTSTLDVGTQAVNRSQAAQGFLGSGNQATALQQFGQSFASSQLLGQEQLLGSLSGAGNASSPSQALTAGTGAFGQSFNQLGSLLASLGYSTTGAGGSTSLSTNGDAAILNSNNGNGLGGDGAGGGLAGFSL